MLAKLAWVSSKNSCFSPFHFDMSLLHQSPSLEFMYTRIHGLMSWFVHRSEGTKCYVFGKIFSKA